MNPLRTETPHGVWGTALLPIDANDEIDWPRLTAELELLVTSPLHGVYAHGTAGEFHTLSELEFDRVSELVAEHATHAGKPFQLGASHPSAQLTVRRIERTKALEPGAFQVILPDWLRLSDRECTRFLSRIADIAAPVPLVLYNPPHAKTAVWPDQIERLLDAVPTLIGIKVAGGNDDWYDSMANVLGRCAVFVPGHRLATGVTRGARGSYSNIAALSPAGAARWYATIARDPGLAIDIERRIGELFDLHIAPLQNAGISDPALDKFLATVGGWTDVGLRIRWPYDAAPAAAVEPARAAARHLLPELFEE